jgi:hypothetical protein
MSTKITGLKISRVNGVWVYLAISDQGPVASFSIDGIRDDDLHGAIIETCRELGLELTADQFCVEYHTNGGYATWIADD